MAWYAADDANIVLNGSNVSTWPNKVTSTGLAAAQGTAAKQPAFVASGQNGKPVVRFNAASQQTLITSGNFPLTGNLTTTVFTAVSPASNTSNTGIWGWGSTAVAAGEFGFYSSVQLVGEAELQHAGGNPCRFGAGTYTAGAQLFTITKSPGAVNTTTAMRRNGVALTNQATSSANTLAIASGALYLGSWSGGAYLSGDLMAVIVYNRVLNASEITQVEGYINGKWALY
ncbi:MAG: hypothetical protein JO152_09985 [Mycobacteriaceae bacterium]|nr:hypothetical protein [Mycobacteriaceae bacterium]